jgi:hypothetical protein
MVDQTVDSWVVLMAESSVDLKVLRMVVLMAEMTAESLVEQTADY